MTTPQCQINKINNINKKNAHQKIQKYHFQQQTIYLYFKIIYKIYQIYNSINLISFSYDYYVYYVYYVYKIIANIYKLMLDILKYAYNFTINDFIIDIQTFCLYFHYTQHTKKIYQNYNLHKTYIIYFHKKSVLYMTLYLYLYLYKLYIYLFYANQSTANSGKSIKTETNQYQVNGQKLEIYPINNINHLCYIFIKLYIIFIFRPNNSLKYNVKKVVEKDNKQYMLQNEVLKLNKLVLYR